MTTVGHIGFRAGLAACAATLAYDVVQILQVVGVLHFPLDEILIFGASLCIVVPSSSKSSPSTTPARARNASGLTRR